MDGPPGEQATAELLVCVTCRSPAARAGAGEAAEPRPGARLLERIRGETPAGVSVRAVECLSNCDHGCTVALRGPGRWTYVYGNLDPDAEADLAALLDGAHRYRATADGLVPWRERPQHFRKNCIARIPPPEAAVD